VTIWRKCQHWQIRQKPIYSGNSAGNSAGKLQAASEAVIETLELRFGVVPRSVIKEIDKIEELTFLKILHKQGVTFESLDQSCGFGVQSRVSSKGTEEIGNTYFSAPEGIFGGME